jgi:hypothetical protein
VVHRDEVDQAQLEEVLDVAAEAAVPAEAGHKQPQRLKPIWTLN